MRGSSWKFSEVIEVESAEYHLIMLQISKREGGNQFCLQL